MTRTIQQEQRNKSTKNYDAVSIKVSKLLSATAQTFVPELCEGLAKDWYPRNSHEQIKQSKEARDEIREKILQDWSYDYSVLKGHNIWSEATINVSFPGWLRNPTMQDSAKENLRLANEARLSKKIMINQAQKQKLENIANTLPDSVIIPEEKPKKTMSDESYHDLGLAPYGDSKISPYEFNSQIHQGARMVFRTLCNDKEPPIDASEDLLVDYIKPTREYRLGMALELSETERVDMHNLLHNLIEISEDMITQLDKADKK